MLGLPLFPASNELHLIHLVSDMLGGYPLHMINESPIINKFESTGYLILDEEINELINNFEPYFIHRNLSDIILSYKYDSNEDFQIEFEKRKVFIDFLSKLLEIDPNNRLTAEEALNHQFFKLEF